MTWHSPVGNISYDAKIRPDPNYFWHEIWSAQSRSFATLFQLLVSWLEFPRPRDGKALSRVSRGRSDQIGGFCTSSLIPTSWRLHHGMNQLSCDSAESYEPSDDDAASWMEMIDGKWAICHAHLTFTRLFIVFMRLGINIIGTWFKRAMHPNDIWAWIMIYAFTWRMTFPHSNDNIEWLHQWCSIILNHELNWPPREQVFASNNCD